MSIWRNFFGWDYISISEFWVSGLPSIMWWASSNPLKVWVGQKDWPPQQKEIVMQTAVRLWISSPGSPTCQSTLKMCQHPWLHKPIPFHIHMHISNWFCSSGELCLTHLPKPKFPHASQGSILQAGLPMKSSLRLSMLTLLYTTNLYSCKSHRAIIPWSSRAYGW